MARPANGIRNPWLAAAFGVCAVITTGLTGVAIWALFQPGLWIATLVVLPFAAIMAWLSRVTWREMHGIPPPPLLRPDPRQPDALVWLGSRARAWGSFIGAAALGLLALAMLGLAFEASAAPDLSAAGEIAIVALLALVAAAMAALAQLLWRNGRGFHGARLVLAAEGLAFELPPWRSLIHRPDPASGLWRWDEIAGIETRLEGYRSQGMAQLLRPYWLVARDGRRLFLFEGRGVESEIATRSLEEVAQAIRARARAGGTWQELPMVEGEGGFLGVWGAMPPAPGAPALSPDRAARVRAGVAFTSMLAGSAFAIVMLARALAWLLDGG